MFFKKHASEIFSKHFADVSFKCSMTFALQLEVAQSIRITRTLVAYASRVEKFATCPNVTWIDDADLAYIPVTQSTRIGAFLSN